MEHTESKQFGITETFSNRQVLAGILYLAIGHLFAIPVILFIVLGEDNLVLLELIAVLTAVVFFCALSYKLLIADFPRFLRNVKMLIWLIPVLYMAQLLGRMVVLVVMTIIHGETDMGANQEIVEEMVNQTPLLAGFIAVILAPLWEELFFTGLIFGTLRRKNRFLAYAAASILFGLLHTIWGLLFDFTPILLLVTIVYVPTSLVCCYIYEKTDSLWSAIALHSFSNLLATLLILYI